MIFSAIGVVGMLSGLLFGRNELQRWMPFHISGGNTIVTGIILILIFVVYFYFSYQLLLGSQSVSYEFD